MIRAKRGGLGHAVGRDEPSNGASSLSHILMTALQVLQSSKALPPPAKDNLPPTPPQDHSHSFPSPPPQLPPKAGLHHGSSPLSNGLRPPPAPIDIAATDELLGQGGFLCSFSILVSHPAFFHQTLTLALPHLIPLPVRPVLIHALGALTH